MLVSSFLQAKKITWGGHRNLKREGFVSRPLGLRHIIVFVVIILLCIVYCYYYLSCGIHDKDSVRHEDKICIASAKSDQIAITVHSERFHS